MKKLLIAVVITSVFAVGVAADKVSRQPSAQSAVKPTQEQIREHEEGVLRRTGGKIEIPGSQKGEIVFVNCQSAAKVGWIRENIAYLAKETLFRISLKEGKFNFTKPEIQGNVSLFIIDDASLPSLLAAPEDKWVVVNVSRLKSDKEPFFEARVKKELTRGFAYLCGGTSSQYPSAITGSIVKVDDLDTLVDYRLPIDVLMRFQKSMPAFGVSAARIITYRNACRQGFAPPPTNEYQKVIWDQMHEIPKKPIKIEYDEKRDKGK